MGVITTGIRRGVITTGIRRGVITTGIRHGAIIINYWNQIWTIAIGITRGTIFITRMWQLLLAYNQWVISNTCVNISGLGGTCVNVGCIPKKLMHQSAILGECVIRNVY